MSASTIFTAIAKDPKCQARTGYVDLPHGRVRTPVFMPVGTNATVKAVSKDSIAEIGFEIMLANTYHLFLRPGHELIREAGGLHGFTGWKGNFLTDSGGFQVFSLSKLRKISDEGVKFQSHIDGSRHFLSPELVVDIQTAFRSDVFMQLDVCTPWGADEKASLKALNQTSAWAARSKRRWEDTRGDFQGKLFGIVQGNFYKELRTRSAEEILAVDTPGVAIGGLSVGEPFEVYAELLAFTSALLPEDKPRYVMGIGTPEYILEAVQNGIDMFDCVYPTRTARNGLLFTSYGPISIKQAQYVRDFSPADPECGCRVCRDYSRAYLRHLYKNDEILFSMLASYHNLAFLYDLVKRIRYSIEGGEFIEFKRTFLSKYQSRQ
ncbi:MAG: tRNA guanosine(34) transglycosylase Tgt [Spirochaetes bacterium]|nr:tRNA guanosine(34) transglycosylase Tgt [Spirochaetota bacterium]MBU1082205.1 tRNA guanosine(34) transglycosylase Tgt [Spirochaetota bacterium]